MIAAAVDNDILHKGAVYGLLKELIEAIPATVECIGILGAAQFTIGKRLRKNGTPEACACFDELTRRAIKLEPTEAEALYAADLEYASNREGLGLHGGESQLCAIVVMRAAPYLVTGDKKAIRSIEAMLEMREETNKLAGKVLCLEQLVLRLLLRNNPDTIRKTICVNESADRVLAICFSCKNLSTPAGSWVACLKSYISDIRADAPNVLAAD